MQSRARRDPPQEATSARSAASEASTPDSRSTSDGPASEQATLRTQAWSSQAAEAAPQPGAWSVPARASRPGPQALSGARDLEARSARSGPPSRAFEGAAGQRDSSRQRPSSGEARRAPAASSPWDAENRRGGAGRGDGDRRGGEGHSVHSRGGRGSVPAQGEEWGYANSGRGAVGGFRPVLPASARIDLETSKKVTRCVDDCKRVGQVRPSSHAVRHAVECGTQAACIARLLITSQFRLVPSHVEVREV